MPLETRRQRTSGAFLISLSLFFFPVGCGTYASTSDAWPKPAFYGGVRFDLEAVSDGVRHPHLGPCTFGPYYVLFGTLDAPLSLAADTLLLPLLTVSRLRARSEE